MKTSKPTNMAASVRARLLSVSKASGEDFTYVLTRYALERLLARLERSTYRKAARAPPTYPASRAPFGICAPSL